MDAGCGAGVRAGSAPDTFRGDGDLFGLKVQGARLLTGHAGGTLLPFPAYLYQAETVEPSIDRSQRAEILAERTVYFRGQEQNGQQKPQLPEKQQSGLAAQQGVGAQQGQGAEKGAGGTEIFTKSRRFGKISSQQEQGAGACQKNQDGVLSIFQDMMERKPFFLAEKRNFMQQVLQKSERTEPAAHKPSQQTSEQEEKSQHGKRHLEPPAVEKGLERAHGAGGQCAGAGITVQSGYADIFQVSLVDLSIQESVRVPVCDDGINDLYNQSDSFHGFTRFRCIPGRS